MNKNLIFKLSLFGLFMAIARYSWIPSTIEPVFWIVIFLICAYFIAKKCTQKYFLHGFLVSLINSVWVTSAHIILYDNYMDDHPDEAAMLQQLSSLSPKLMLLCMGLIIGILSGL